MTTIEDLQKWDENFYTGTVGGKGFLARQLQRGKLNNDSTIAYAFGLEVGSYRGLPMVEHSGSTGGYRTDIARFPSAHTSVATMCNVSNADAGRPRASRRGHRARRQVHAAGAGCAPTRAATQQGAATDHAHAGRGRRRWRAGTTRTSSMRRTSYRLLERSWCFAGRAPRPIRCARSTIKRCAAPASRIRFPQPVGGGTAANFTVDNGRARGLEFSRTER